MMKKLSQNPKEKEKTGFFLLKQNNFAELLFLLFIFFLPTQFGKHFWPDFTFVSGVRIDYLSPTIYLTDILLFFLSLSVLWTPLRRKFLPSLSRNGKILVIVFFCLLVFQVLASQSPLSSLYGIVKLFEMIIFTLLVRVMLTSNFIQSKLSLVFGATLVFQSLLAISQFLLQKNLGGFFYFLGERMIYPQTPGAATMVVQGDIFLRSYGTFSHPNVLAGFLVFSLTLVLQSMFVRGNRIMKGLCLFVGTLGLLVTGSRFSIFLWVLILFTFLVVKKQLVRKYVVGVSLLLVVAGVLFPSALLRLLQTLFADESFIVRQTLFTQSFSTFLSQPFFGVGLQQYFSAVAKSSQGLAINLLQPVHNIYLLFTLQTGLVGLLIALYAVVDLFTRYSQSLKTRLSAVKAKDQRFLLSPLCLFSIFCIIGLQDHYLLTLQQGQLLFAFAWGYGLWSVECKA